MKLYASLLLTLAVAGCASPPGRAPAHGPASTTEQTAVPQPQSGPDDVIYNLMLADIATQRGAFDVAAKYYTAAALETRDPIVAQRAARASLYAQDLDAAIPAAEVWRDLQPADPDPYQLLAILYLQKGDTERARANLRELLARGTFNSTEDYLNLARLFNQEGAREAMMLMMDELVAARPGDTHALYVYVVVAVRMEQLDQALRASTKLVALRPDWQEAVLAHAQVLELRDDRPAAASFLREHLQRQPQHDEVRMGLARMLVDLKDYAGARDEFRRLHRVKPQDADLLLALTLVNLQLKDTTAVRRNLDALARLPGQAARANFYRGRLADIQKQPAEALKWYALVDDDEHRLDAVVRRAEILAAQGQLDAATALLHAQETDDPPTHTRLLLAEVNLLLDARQYPRAESVVNQGLALYADDVDLLFARSMVLEKLGRFPAMEADLKNVLAREPDNAHVLNALGYTLADRGERLEEAHQLIERALTLAPGNPYILDSMGWVLYRQGQNEPALDYLRQSLAALPDPEVYLHIATVLHALGRPDEAREMLRRGLADSPQDERLKTLLEQLGP